jgi:hypothetical protein
LWAYDRRISTYIGNRDIEAEGATDLCLNCANRYIIQKKDVKMT